MRSKQIIVVEEGSLNHEITRSYIHEGYGLVLIPDLASLPHSTSDYLLTVAADEIQEFLKDGQQVILLNEKKARWTGPLATKLAKRKLIVESRQLS
jgi:hypothetical protein